MYVIYAYLETYLLGAELNCTSENMKGTYYASRRMLRRLRSEFPIHISFQLVWTGLEKCSATNSFPHSSIENKGVAVNNDL